MTQYKPKYKWHRTKLDENDVPTDNDWSGYDGEIVIGRIQKQPHGPMKDRWLWSGHGPRVRERLSPHQGYEAEGREAMRMVEEYYDRLMAHNGLMEGEVMGNMMEAVSTLAELEKEAWRVGQEGTPEERARFSATSFTHSSLMSGRLKIIGRPPEYTEDQINRLQSGGCLYSFEKTWKETPDYKKTVSVGQFLDKEEGEAQFALSLHEVGYQEPKWWQYWRWNEHRVSPSVRARLAALKEQEKVG